MNNHPNPGRLSELLPMHAPDPILAESLLRILRAHEQPKELRSTVAALMRRDRAVARVVVREAA